MTAIVPTWRRPQMLERSLGSILAQTWRPLELVVIDDGSGDETPDVLESFQQRAEAAGVAYDWASIENSGVSIARNEAMKRANGEFFAFLDDDDIWLPEKLERQMPTLMGNPNVGVGFTRYRHSTTDSKAKPKEDQMQGGWAFASLCRGDTRAHLQTLVIRRDVFEKTAGFRDWGYPIGTQFEDSDLCLRAALEYEFVACPEALTVIYTQDETLSRRAGLEGDLKRDAAKLEILAGLADEFKDHPRYDHDALLTYRARVYDEHIKHLVWLGRVKEAKETFARAQSECADQPYWKRLKKKLRSATIAGVFGKRLKKP